MKPRDVVLELVEKLSNLRKRPCYIYASRHVHRSDCREAHRKLESVSPELGKRGLDLVVQAPGGDLNAAYIFVRQLHRRFPKLTAFVPTFAKSAATLICLGVHELVLGPFGELGPLDAQLRESTEDDAPELKSALNRFKALEQLRRYALESYDLATLLVLRRSGMKIGQASRLGVEFAKIVSEPLFARIDPLRVAESERSLELGVSYADRILGRYIGQPEDEREELVRRLVRDYPSHGFVIDHEELVDLGLPVRPATDKEGSILDALYDPLCACLNEDIFEVIQPGGQLSLAEDADDSGEDESGPKDLVEPESA